MGQQNGVASLLHLGYLLRGQRVDVEQEVHHVAKTQTETGQGVGDSVVKPNLILTKKLSPVGAGVSILILQPLKELGTSFLVAQIGFL